MASAERKKRAINFMSNVVDALGAGDEREKADYSFITVLIHWELCVSVEAD